MQLGLIDKAGPTFYLISLLTLTLSLSISHPINSQQSNYNKNGHHPNDNPFLISHDDLIEKSTKHFRNQVPDHGFVFSDTKHPFERQFQRESKKLKQKFWADVTPLIIISVLIMIAIFLIGQKQNKNKTATVISEPIPEVNNNQSKTIVSNLESQRMEKVIQEGLATTVIKVRCRSCNHLNDEGNSYCSDCGKKV